MILEHEDQTGSVSSAATTAASQFSMESWSCNPRFEHSKECFERTPQTARPTGLGMEGISMLVPVESEKCPDILLVVVVHQGATSNIIYLSICLLYTSDAADE